MFSVNRKPDENERVKLATNKQPNEPTKTVTEADLERDRNQARLRCISHRGATHPLWGNITVYISKFKTNVKMVLEPRLVELGALELSLARSAPSYNDTCSLLAFQEN